MPSSDIWLPLVLALIGILGTVINGQLTQRRADRREAARDRLEATREATRQAREDAARLFDHRRDAYVGFLSKAGSDINAWIDYQNSPDPMEPSEDTLLDLWAQVTEVRIYGSPEAARIAEALYEWIRTDIFGGKKSDHEGGYGRLEAEFVQQIRRDLGVEPSQAIEQHRA